MSSPVNQTPVNQSGPLGAGFTPWFGVEPNLRAHRTLLWLGLVVSVVFNAAILVDGALRPGYDWLRQPMSALSLGPGGWLQVTGFIVFGVFQCVTAAAWRASLVGGFGVTAMPVLKILSGLTLIGAGVFTQDPALGYPLGVPAPAAPSLHAVIHQGVSYVSLSAAVATLVVLAIRFAREPGWRRWAPWAVLAAVAMMASLATFGALIGHGGDGGIFEKLASWIPTLYGLAIVVRLLAGDARIGAHT
ncbi:DUF998 domain-containing protein [Specibacter cremeus]|uniref:DUF998 domain-containing protein n=1 Tax=Specibacter cremeus TaxID=1629051 RepID=UPI000F7BB089|nr:DUF998 domain-containing protein [Specibacter cremeus]